MDPERARELLAAERTRIEEALAVLDTEGSLEASDRVEPGDKDSEDLYEDEFNAGRVEDLHTQLAALETCGGATGSRHLRAVGRKRRTDPGHAAGGCADRRADHRRAAALPGLVAVTSPGLYIRS